MLLSISGQNISTVPHSYFFQKFIFSPQKLPGRSGWGDGGWGRGKGMESPQSSKNS